MIHYYATEEWPYHISAGGVIVGNVHSDTERVYALLYRSPAQRGGDMEAAYHLPKGTLEPSETLEECAKREMLEESGIEVELEAYLGSVHRKFDNPFTHFVWDRTVHYYLGVYKNGSKKDMDSEHDDLIWVNAQEAMEMLEKSPKNEEVIVSRAEEYFKDIINEQQQTK